MNDEDMQALHAELLQLILDVDRLCKKHGIAYQLAAGTLLGAVRHQGFIPWDDDADVCMLRADYERFIQVADSELSPELFLQCSANDKTFRVGYAKLKPRHSDFRTQSFFGTATLDRVFLDIFPFDAVAPDSWPGRLHMNAHRLMKILTDQQFSSTKAALNHRKHPLAKRWAKRLLFHLVKGLGRDRVLRWQTGLARYRNSRPHQHVTCLVAVPLGRRTRYQRIRRLEDFTRTELASFHGHLLPIPCNYDQVLRNLYGDYMQLPPDAERIAKHGIRRAQGSVTAAPGSLTQ